jgi:hypothetical protein
MEDFLGEKLGGSGPSMLRAGPIRRAIMPLPTTLQQVGPLRFTSIVFHGWRLLMEALVEWRESWR